MLRDLLRRIPARVWQALLVATGIVLLVVAFCLEDSALRIHWDGHRDE